MTRRDKCFTVGSRALRLNGVQVHVAWQTLAMELQAMGDMDVPKFKHLLKAVQRGYIKGRRAKL